MCDAGVGQPLQQKITNNKNVWICLWCREIVCLTFSHGPGGLSNIRKRTSAKAGCGSAFVQVKMRSPLSQDMIIFVGASYFAAEQSRMLRFFTFMLYILYFLSCRKKKKTGGNSGGAAPVWPSVTEFFSEGQLEFPTWAFTQMSTGADLITSSSNNVYEVFLMPGIVFSYPFSGLEEEKRREEVKLGADQC